MRSFPLAISVLVAVLVGSMAGLAYLSSLSEYFVRQTALTSARLETKMLDEVWRFYSEEIQDIDFTKTNIAIARIGVAFGRGCWSPVRRGSVPVPAVRYA